MSCKIMAGEATHSYEYDVFLSFRGADTRWGFTGNLHRALVGRGIRTFLDDKDLQKGFEELTPALLTAIQQSRTAITVLSPNYAFSSFCLNELATIIDLFNEKKIKRVFPLFYGVDPSDVRHLRGSYNEAFAIHKRFKAHNEEKMSKWKKALKTAADLPGFFYNQRDMYECDFISSILKKVSANTDRIPFHITEHPVGLDSRVKNVVSLLNVESESDDYIVGIHGIGGVGKSTIARAVYNSIFDHFEGLCCFLGDVREGSIKHGLVHLQKTILSVIFQENDTIIQNENHGKSILKRRLHKKKVLLVLDNVDQPEQLKALVGGRDWFGSGSRVIITTRQEHLLMLHDVKKTYPVQGLSDTDAHDLLSWHAFKGKEIEPRYSEILNRAIGYSFRIPLALEVIGSNLFGKDVDDCKATLDRYDKSLDKKIQDVLRISFNSLGREEQTVFLDIACCFGGYKLSEVENILQAHYGSPMRSNINTLIEKSLIKTDDGFLTLHALIQEMGREIVREESPEPSQRSRLWYYDDVVQVLREENMGTIKIEILVLDFPEDGAHLEGPNGEEVPLEFNGEAIKEMANLKTLIIRNSHFSRGPTQFPKRLRVLKWWRYPSSSLPQYFQLNTLTILELPESSFRNCEPIQMLQYLTVLDFSYNEHITEIPDVSGVRNLEKLSLKHCKNLTKIHSSVGLLNKLRILDVSNCKSLEKFPSIRMTCLEQFNLSHCSNLKDFPEILGKMEKITELHITGSPINKFPFSIQNLVRLRKLELQHGGMVSIPNSIVMLPELGLMCVSQCKGFKLSELDKSEKMDSNSSYLESLTLFSCKIPDVLLPEVLTVFAYVKDANLSGNNFEVLDACFKECHLLRSLKLDDCISLTKIRGIPVKLEMLSLKGCIALEYLDLTVLPACTEGNHFLKELVLDDCMFLKDIRGLTPTVDHFSAKNCTSLTSSCTSMLLDQEWVETRNKMFFLPGTKIPEWFTPHTSGVSMSFKFRNKFPAISLCVVIKMVNEQPITVNFSPIVSINGKKQSVGIQKLYELTTTDHVILFDLPLPKFEDNADVVFPDNKWNTVEVSYADHITYDEVQVARHSGIHVSNTSYMEDILFINHVKPMKNVTPNLNLEGPSKRSTTKRPRKDQTMMLSMPIPTLIQPLPTEGEKGLTDQPMHLVKRPWGDVQSETSKRLPEDEVCSTVQNDPFVIERFINDDDAKLEAVPSCEPKSEEPSSDTTDSDSDNPFNLVNEKHSVSGKQTISLGDASLVSVTKAIDELRLLMIKGLSEVSSNPAMQTQLGIFLSQLTTTSSHCKMTVEVHEALEEFRRKALKALEEFQATIQPVKNLKFYENENTIIQNKTSAGKNRWKELKKSIKNTSSDMAADEGRKEKLESEIENMKKQIVTKEVDIELLVLNVKKHKATLETYKNDQDFLKGQARVLSKEGHDLHAAYEGIANEAKEAEEKQIKLNYTWSNELLRQLHKIRETILDLSWM